MRALLLVAVIGCAKESHERAAPPQESAAPPAGTVTPVTRDAGADATAAAAIAVELDVAPAQVAHASVKDVVVRLTVRNRTQRTIDPQINLSELRVDGVVSKEWNVSLMNSGHPSKWKALPPNDSVSGAVKIGPALFTKPGDYTLVLVVMGVSSPAVSVRVTP